MDGRNGFSEFSVACAKLNIPLLRYELVKNKMEPMPAAMTDRRRRRVTSKTVKTDAPHLLALRYEDGDHERHPILRRIVVGGRRYKLVGLYKGHRKCGHQIGACSHTGDWREWSLGDADLHKDGIGPIFVKFVGKRWVGDEWWRAWHELVHVTKFGANYREMCNLNWQNARDDALDGFRGPHKVGRLSIDVVYAHQLF